MEPERQTHEIVHFRKEEIADLGNFPSSGEPILAAPVPPRRPSYRLRRVAQTLYKAVLLILVLVAIAIGSILQFGIPDAAMSRLRLQAEQAASRFAGEPVKASLGPLAVSLSSMRAVALEVSDLNIAAESKGGTQVSAGRVQFGLRLWPLLQGQLQLRNAALSDAKIVLGALPDRGGADWSAFLKNDQGLIESDLVLAALFDGLHRAFNGLDAGKTRSMALENIDIVVPGAEDLSFKIKSATLERTPGNLAIDADLQVDDRTISVRGTAKRDGAEGVISYLRLSIITNPPAKSRPLIDDGIAKLEPTFGVLSLELTGNEQGSGKPGQLIAKAKLADTALDLGRHGIMQGTAELGAELIEGSGKLEISHLVVHSGDSNLSFNGAIGPRPSLPGVESEPAYRFELVSDGSQLAALGLDEPPLAISVKLGGTFLPKPNILRVDDLRLNTPDGDVVATGQLQLAGQRVPGIDAKIAVSSMPVSAAKQIWPFVVSPNGRAWVLKNVHGGRVTESAIEISVPPGRLGDGKPLVAADASGHFALQGASFDFAETMPRVKDVDGIVRFGGNSVEIGLTRGTATVPEAGKVTIANGTLSIPGGQVGGTWGDLKLSLSGDAKSVTDIASRKPVDAMKTVGFAPSDFTGAVTADVVAKIPFDKVFERERLTWKVDLAFKQLALAKEFSGQKLTEADGTADINPDRAIIKAKGKLNNIPATIDMIEPISPKVVRQRLVELTLDNATRDASFPALKPLITGPLVLKVDAKDPDKQKVTSDLSKAEIRIPWVGWSKGSGVQANLAFTLSGRNGDMSLDDFNLSGKSFQAAGALKIANGGLSSARFNTLRFNRDDIASVSIQRKNKSFQVDAKGSSFDVRPLIRHYLGDASDTGSGSGDGADTGINLNASFDKVIGFNNESASNLKISYDASGLRLSGVLSSGGAVAFTTTTGAARTMKLQSTDAGALLRFVDLYDYMQSGRIELSLVGQGKSTLSGTIDASNFHIVGEPRLKSIVSTAPPKGRSLNEQLRDRIDTSSVFFERGTMQIVKTPGGLKLAQGVVRGPTIGASFQGTAFDQGGNMDMTGTFMPAYGVNRIFGQLPIIGQILGNGRDGGLIGITFRLAGNAKKPDLQINPISAIAPGIFRSIFEF